MSRLLRIIAIILIMSIFAACGGSITNTGSNQPTKTDDLTFTDATHTTVTLTKQPTRIACLVGICEDILADLGLDPVAVNDKLGQDPAFLGIRRKTSQSSAAHSLIPMWRI